MARLVRRSSMQPDVESEGEELLTRGSGSPKSRLAGLLASRERNGSRSRRSPADAAKPPASPPEETTPSDGDDPERTGQQQPENRQSTNSATSLAENMADLLGFRWVQEQPDETIMKALDVELMPRLEATGYLRSLTCWRLKSQNMDHLSQTEHLIGRLQAYSNVNLHLKLGQRDDANEVCVELLNTLRVEVKHATGFLQLYARHLDHACMNFLKWLRLTNERSVDSELEAANAKLMQKLESLGKLPAESGPPLRNLCDILGIAEPKDICSDLCQEFSRRLPFGCIWQAAKLWDLRNTEAKEAMLQHCSAGARQEAKEVLEICLHEIPFIASSVLNELVPTFMQRMNLLRSALVRDVDIGQQMQNKVLAGMASVLFTVGNYVLHRRWVHDQLEETFHMSE